MLKRVSDTELSEDPEAIIALAEAGHEVIITQRGRDVARLEPSAPVAPAVQLDD